MADKNIKLDMIIGAFIVLIFVVFSLTELPFFEKIERRVYDMGIRFAQADDQSFDKIVLIDIDDKSFNTLGQWPWPRSLIAEMIDTLNGNGAKLIGLNIPFTEKEVNEGLRELKAFRKRYNAYPPTKKDISLRRWVIENLDQVNKRLDNDLRLVESVKMGKNIVLPILVNPAVYRKKSEDDSSLTNNFINSSNISPSVNERVKANRLSYPFKELAQNAAGLGHGDLSFENNWGGRSHPAYINHNGFLLPSFPLRLAIAYLDIQPKQVYAEDNLIKLKDRTIPLTKGEILIKFKDNEKMPPRFSFADILINKKMQSSMKEKIIIIGFNHSESRKYDTPNSPNMSESELNAHILENIINSGPITRPTYMSYIETLIVLLLGIFTLLFFPLKRQLIRLGGTVVMVLLALTAGVLLLSVMGIWFKPIYIAGCLVAVYLYILASEFLFSGKFARESHETNRLLGLSFQSQGLLDLAFDKFQKLPLDNETKDLIYNLGLEYEKKRLINKALTAYEYINKKGGFRDLDDRMPKLKASDKSSTLGSYDMAKEASIVSDSERAVKSIIGRYEILNELGKGSMGLVYKAQDPKINRIVAIKTIRFSDEFDEDVIQEIKERFFREAEIAGQLSHPSIVTIHDVGDDGDLTYMAMEFLEGEDLDKFTKTENLLPLRRVLYIVARIADALDFAHKAEVIHRDIKPANVMLLKNGQIKVTDFGIAKAISSSRTRTGVILGTPNYMSPEQIMGQKIDSKSDIFSLGVLFYQLVTGELPFHGENLSGLLYQITQVKHPSPRSYNQKIPKVCEQILDKALAKDPNNRFRKAGDLANIVNVLGEKIDQLKRKKTLNK
ncbi:CHASE2 domain-containing serine/threonine-protein kinase [Thermodesulfobacteriota bacterium]